MKIKSNYMLKEVLGNSVVVDVLGNGKSVFKLNDSATFMFNLLKEGINSEELIAKLCKQYEIDVELAKKDVETFINSLKEIGALDNE